MKHLLHMLALVLSISIGHSAAAQTYDTGMRDIKIKDNTTARPLEAILWYPTKEGAKLKRQHSNGVWLGVEVAKKAKPIEGTFPLVLLSHGMYGNARNQNWLALELVQAGYIVASLNHPGTSTWERDADDAREIWERPKDVSRAISYLLNDPKTKDRIDRSRIYMAGHSLGGMTAVQLAGGRYDPAKVDAYCAADPAQLICEIVEMWQLGKTPEDRIAIAQDLSDPRIKGIAVLDLGATQTFAPDSLGAIKTPLLVVGAPKDVKGSLDLDVEARALVAMLPSTTTTYIEPSNLAHFDMLGNCTENAVLILEEETPGDGMVCIDGTEERLLDHKIVADAVLEFFVSH